MSFRRLPVKPHLTVDAGAATQVRPCVLGLPVPVKDRHEGLVWPRIDTPVSVMPPLGSDLDAQASTVGLFVPKPDQRVYTRDRTLKLLTLSWIEIENKPICQRS
jgi:hypothetical protein